MLKMFTTQLFGVFKNIQTQEETIEDCSRLLAQSIIGSGRIYITGYDELQSIASVIMNSEESLPAIAQLNEQTTLEPEDCVLAYSRTANDERLQTLIEDVESTGASIITVAAIEKDKVVQNEDFHIDTKLINGLVPDDEGERIGYPPFICALFVYYALYFNITEMLDEYGQEL